MNIIKIKKTSSGAAAPKDPNVTIIATKDIISWPARNSKKVLMVGNFVFGPNPKIAEVYMTSSKTKAPYESDGDEDAISLKQKFEGEHPGNELEINEFIANWLGEPCIIIHGSCQDAFKKVVGTKCAPVQLKPSGQDDNDARKHMLVFEQFAKTELLPGHFTGTVPTVEPFAVTVVTAIDLTEANGYVYKLPALAISADIAFGTVTLLDKSVITLVGSGGAGPARFQLVSALLVSGIPWYALEGATLTLEIFVAGATRYYIERART